MKLKISAWIFLGFCLFGLLVMLWSVWHWYALQSGQSAGPSFCNINSYWNCDRVSLSEHGKLFGLPIGIWGALYFVFLGCLSLWRSIQPRHLLLACVPSLLACFYFMYILFFVVSAGCLVCMMGYLCFFGAAVSAWFFKKEGGLTLSSSVIAFIVGSVLLGFFAMSQQGSVTALPDKSELDRFKIWFNDLPTEDLPASPFKKGQFSSSLASNKVIVTEFSDFGCPYCGKAAQELVPIILGNPKVEFHFFPMPLDSNCNPRIPAGAGHKNSCEWVRASMCAQEQGEFWAVHDIAFEQAQQNEYRLPHPKDVLSKTKGLDLEKLTQCMASEETTKGLEGFLKLSSDLKVESTPTFFINGKRVSGYLDPRLFLLLIDEAGK